MNPTRANDSFTRFEPPDDRLFQDLLRRAVSGEIPVYGVVVDLQEVVIKRRYEHHRPEKSEAGKKIVESMYERWQSGNGTQPWLYVWKGEYTVADDYFWIALIEQGKPRTVAAQVLGEPMEAGLKQKVGPLDINTVQRMLGVVRKS